MTQERLQKALARAGFGSRRSCEELIAAGRVKVNGEVAVLGSRVDPERDEVDVDGVRVSVDPDHIYLALHKPVGVITTMRDPQRRPTVAGLVPAEPRVFPVGRLDADTAGLLLLTNDGDFANRIAHPSFGVPKTYVAKVRGAVTNAKLRRLARGVELDDGVVRATEARRSASSGERSVVEVTVTEGRNRMVRRMLEAVGLEVSALVRTSIGPIRLGRLKEGGWRVLKPSEVRALSEHTPA